MNTAIAYIDISRPSGRRIVSEIENRKAVRMEYSLPTGISENARDWDEVYEKGLDMLSAHYGVDMRALKSTLE